MYYFRYLLINKHNKKVDTHSVNAKKNKLYYVSPIALAPPFM